MAPFTPFYSEHSFNELQSLNKISQAESVHHVQITPFFKNLKIDYPLLQEIKLF